MISNVNAALARYPQSSKILKNKNIRIIIGKKVRTPPTPPMIPSQMKEDKYSFGMKIATFSASIPNASSIQSWKGAPNVYVNWNIAHIIIINMNGAKSLFVTILSILSVVDSFSTAGLLTDSAISPPINAYLAFATTSSAPSLKMS